MQEPAQPKVTQSYFSFADSCICVTDVRPDGHVPRTLFLIHGRLESSRAWEPLVQMLGAPGSRARCVSIDFPGFGRSFSARRNGLRFHELVALVKRILQRFGDDQSSVLVAHDSGGAIAQVCATDPEAKVHAMVLMNSASLRDSPGSVSWFERILFRRKLAQLTGPEDCHQIIREHWDDRRLRKESIRAINTLARSWPKNSDWDLWKTQLTHLKIPTLLLWGGADPIHSVEHGLDLLNLLPNASFFTDERSGHWPALENPRWVSQKIREFLFQLGSAGNDAQIKSA